ncbi:MAG: hypothetical protein AAF645_05855 [Myxococcota bacterium]
MDHDELSLAELARRGAVQGAKEDAERTRQAVRRTAHRPKLERRSTRPTRPYAAPLWLALVGFFVVLGVQTGGFSAYIADAFGVELTYPLLFAVLLGLTLVAYLLREALSQRSHAAVVQWVRKLPFELADYPTQLGFPAIYVVVLEIEFKVESEGPSQEQLSAAAKGLGLDWLAADGRTTLRVRSNYAPGHSTNWSAHRRVRRVVDELLLVVHRSSPIRRVALEVKQY